MTAGVQRFLANDRNAVRTAVLAATAVNPASAIFRTSTVRSGNGIYLRVESDYQPHRFDWSLLAGVPVHVVLRSGAGNGLRLAAEIASITAPVVLHSLTSANDWANPSGQPAQADLGEIMLAERARLGSWPTYWSERSQADYIIRRERYRAALILDAQRAAEQRL